MTLTSFCSLIFVLAAVAALETEGWSYEDIDQTSLIQTAMITEKVKEKGKIEVETDAAQSVDESFTSDRNGTTSLVQSLQDALYTEIEFELGANESGPPTKNKVMLALIEGLLLPACFGIDRCFMGQPCVGVLKGLTLGGLGIWTLIDYFAILFNMLSQAEKIKSVGYYASFPPGQTSAAMWVMIFLVIFQFCNGCYNRNHSMMRRRMSSPSLDKSASSSGATGLTEAR
mmetsp:Transcript_109270/g.189602  ORF Transcript_109270/g.189602 Transcript_109270/m.189602 type:complete len:229 (-) Transcript_109270:23-709(-)